MQIKNHLIGSSKFRAALCVILLLTEHGGTLTSSEMAQQLNVHSAYLRKIMSTLLKAGMVEAKEGQDGGYKLKHPESDITLADVYDAVREVKKSKTVTFCHWTTSINENLAKLMLEVDECTISYLKEIKATDMISSLNNSN
ncbi:Rrf2 family transcriptional regulator [Paenibacillus sp. TAF43_2]|uniref:RrF2 family transcriptional regulator n=1 Tax=Paenibacillus sp. TAF43_2 TaxID=3233069 RepID=UPI003F984252